MNTLEEIGFIFLNLKESKTKNSKTKKYIFVGYFSNKIHRIYNPIKKKIIVKNDGIFDKIRIRY